MNHSNPMALCLQGILPINKEAGFPSFHLVSLLRKRTGVQKIGHAGTLDPFAKGVMILLIGSSFTKQSDRFLSLDKEYHAVVELGRTTDSFDIDGKETSRSTTIPSLDDLKKALNSFQGTSQQTPPMYSAKKIGGKKLYELARKGIVVERQPVEVRIATTLVRYTYPHVELLIACSKGTYIRSIANDLGQLLGCGAFLSELTRTRVGPFALAHCIPQGKIMDPGFDIKEALITHVS